MSDSEIRAEEIRHGLREFQRKTNTEVRLRLDCGYSAAQVRDSAKRCSEMTYQQRELFCPSTSEAERQAILLEAYTVAISLMTEAELINSDVWLEREYGRASKSKVVVKSKLKAAARSFEGVTSIQALTLMCGYSIDEVTSLNADEVAEAFTFVAKFWLVLFEKQLSWTDLMEFMRIDIDPSLVNDFLGGHDDYPSVS